MKFDKDVFDLSNFDNIVDITANMKIMTIEERQAHREEVTRGFCMKVIDENKIKAKQIASNVVTDSSTVSSVHSLATENILKDETFKKLMSSTATEIRQHKDIRATTYRLQKTMYEKHNNGSIPAYDAQGNIKLVTTIKGSGYDVDHVIPIASLLPGGQNHDLFIKAVKHCNGDALEAMKLFCLGKFNLSLLKAYDNEHVKGARTGSEAPGFNDVAKKQQKGLEDVSKHEATKNANSNVFKSIGESAITSMYYVLLQQALTLVLQAVSDSLMDYIATLMYERHYECSLAIKEATVSGRIKNVFEKKWNQVKHLVSIENIKETFTWENIKNIFKTLLVQGISILVSSISSKFRAAMSLVDVVKNLFKAAKYTCDYYIAETYEEQHEAYKDLRSYIISAISAGFKALAFIIGNIAYFIMLILNPLITMITTVLIFATRMYIDVEDKLNVKRREFNTYMDLNY